MFLTTIRVRRLRHKTLASLPSFPAGQKTAIATGTVVEVLAHSHLVAIVNIAPTPPKVLWTHEALKGDQSAAAAIAQAATAGVALSAAVYGTDVVTAAEAA